MIKSVRSILEYDGNEEYSMSGEEQESIQYSNQNEEEVYPNEEEVHQNEEEVHQNEEEVHQNEEEVHQNEEVEG